MRKDIISMSMQELKRLHLFKKSSDKNITQAKAAALLALAERQFRRIIKNYRDFGPPSLIHKLRGQTSKRKFSTSFFLTF